MFDSNLTPAHAAWTLILLAVMFWNFWSRLIVCCNDRRMVANVVLHEFSCGSRVCGGTLFSQWAFVLSLWGYDFVLNQFSRVLWLQRYLFSTILHLNKFGYVKFNAAHLSNSSCITWIKGGHLKFKNVCICFLSSAAAQGDITSISENATCIRVWSIVINSKMFGLQTSGAFRWLQM